MAKRENQKLKLICLLKILTDKSDESHPLSMSEIIQELSAYDISAERKSIYDDIECLRLLGYDIELIKGKYGGYYLSDRTFESVELKILIDAVSASKFITEKKSNELIKKISSLASKSESGNLRRELYVSNRVKSDNESVFYSVDALYTALSENRNVFFKYLDYSYKKENFFRHNGEIYEVSPLGLNWSDEKYYLIAYEARSGIVKHFRVDKMKNISLSPNKRDLPAEYKDFNPAEYSKTKIGMFSGEVERVSLSVPSSKVGVIIDQFGQDIIIRKINDSTMKCSFDTSVSPQLFGWLSGLGGDVHILSPDSVKDKYLKFLDDILSSYK